MSAPTSVHPFTATCGPRASTATIRRSPNAAPASSRNRGSSAALVPTTAQRAPDARTVSMAPRSRSPPPTCTSTGATAATISLINAVCCGAPENAPSRSTTCNRCAPSSAHRLAVATGSSENTVSASARPSRSRTQRPCRRSMAGMTSGRGRSRPFTGRAPSPWPRSSPAAVTPSAGSSRGGTGSHGLRPAGSPRRTGSRNRTTPS